MPRFTFELADVASDAELRRLLATTPMPGAISFAFAREPSYFGAAEVDGEFVQVVAVRDQLTRRIIGMGSRAVSQHYVNGEVQPVGYLSGLRLLPEFHGQAALLARGFAFFRELHQDRRALFYLTTIAEDNEPALRLLAGERARMPSYHDFGRYLTLVLGRRRPRGHSGGPASAAGGGSVTIRQAEAVDRRLVHDFLLAQGARRQFFPAFHPEDIFATRGRLKQLAPEHTLLAFRRDRLVGTLGLWNQRAFKQVIVRSYGPWTSAARPFYNAWARWRGWPRLPSPGETFSSIYGAIPVVEHDDPHIWEQLLTAALATNNTAVDGTLLLGLCENDPLAATARRLATREYVTRLYVAHWREECFDTSVLHGRVPYLELGCL